MDNKISGDFSASLQSLQLQLKTLLEGFGGDQAIKLLDVLSGLTKSEQLKLLMVFTAVAERVGAGKERLATDGDLALQEFEDRLFNDVLSSIQDEMKSQERRLEVVSGGKTKGERGAPIDLAKARLARKLGSKPMLN